MINRQDMWIFLSAYWMDKWNIAGTLGAAVSWASTYLDGAIKYLTLLGGLVVVVLSIMHGFQKLRINKETLRKLREENAKLSQNIDKK